MAHLFAHSEPSRKRHVRHLRGEAYAELRYTPGMQLRVRELRKARGLTVQQLADLAGLSKSYMSELETGKKTANARRIEQIAKALSVRPFELLDDTSIDAGLLDHIGRLAQMSPEDRLAVLRHAESLVAHPNADAKVPDLTG